MFVRLGVHGRGEQGGQGYKGLGQRGCNKETPNVNFFR